jgi:hypothetical protein
MEGWMDGWYLPGRLLNKYEIVVLLVVVFWLATINFQNLCYVDAATNIDRRDRHKRSN